MAVCWLSLQKEKVYPERTKITLTGLEKAAIPHTITLNAGWPCWSRQSTGAMDSRLALPMALQMEMLSICWTLRCTDLAELHSCFRVAEVAEVASCFTAVQPCPHAAALNVCVYRDAHIDCWVAGHCQQVGGNTQQEEGQDCIRLGAVCAELLLPGHHAHVCQKAR